MMEARSSYVAWGLIVALVAGAGGCATSTNEALDPQPQAEQAAEDSASKGPTLLLRDARDGEHFAALITGDLGVNDQGCVTLRGLVVIATPGSTVDDDSITLDGYGTFAVGDTVTVGGGEEDGVPVEQLRDTERQCFAAEDSSARYIVMSP